MTKPKLRLGVRIVLYRHAEAWIARAFEFDLIGDGATKDEAIQCLMESIRLQAFLALKDDDLRILYRPADGKYFAMFDRGDDVVRGVLELDSLKSFEQDIDSANFESRVGDGC